MASCLNHFKVCILSSLLLLAPAGCQTAKKRQQSAVSCFDNGAAEQAIIVLNQASKARGAEQEIIAIDRALAMAMSGDVARSESELRKARAKIDFLRQKDLREQTAAVLTDDKAIAWTGREFEQRMIDNMLILTSLLGDHQDAFAYAAQAIEKTAADQNELIPRQIDSKAITVGLTTGIAQPTPDARMAANALAAYLHAAVHSENAMSVDITDRSLQLTGYWKGSSSDREVKIPIGTKTRQGYGVLHVITFADRITDWQAEAAEPTSAALLIADQLLSAIGNHTLPPTIAPVKIARPVSQSGNEGLYTSASVHGLSQKPVIGATLIDLNRTAWASYSNDRNQQIARAVVRRIVKKGAVYAAKDQMSVSNNTGLDLLLNVGGVAWEALEKPDTRHLSLLPEHIEVLQLELPAGRHSVDLATTPLSGSVSQHALTTVPVDIENGRNTFLLCYRTDQRIKKVVGAATGK
jgi:hypothetical protein